MSTLNTPQKKRNFRDEMIKHYLYGQNTLEELKKYPTAYENIKKIKSQKERQLSVKLMTSSSKNDFFNECLQDIQKTVKTEITFIDQGTVDVVAMEAVADWLIRCPLSFS